jgi:hypothetical protein
VIIASVGMLATVLLWLAATLKLDMPEAVATALAGLLWAGITWVARQRVVPVEKAQDIVDKAFYQTPVPGAEPPTI